MVTGVHAPLPAPAPPPPEVARADEHGIELIGSGELAVPMVLPVKTLSASSIERYERCPERWRRHYIEREREASSVAMAGGTAVGNTIAAYYQAKRVGEGLRLSAVEERLAAELDAALAEAVARPGEDPARKRDGARRALKVYVEEIAPMIEPAATERQVTMRFPGVEWTVTGYPDIETVDDRVIDVKFGDNHVKAVVVRSGIQPTMYMLGRELEGRPARGGFFYHSGLALGELRSRRRWEVLEAERTAIQLANLQARIAKVARMIARSVLTGDWAYGPNGWHCSEKYCPHHGSCPAGGLR